MNIYTDIEDEVDAIRDTIYDEIKDMSAAEELAYFNAAAEEARTKYHIRVIPAIPGAKKP
ncbi:MAG: hypothetical protein LBC88_06555 [Spirochaetaceae bacterium]|jgi:hypothetical protein|nr:hypothetical protein [Spirochaetaceae bacterium]